jgi:hypothetical protein
MGGIQGMRIACCVCVYGSGTQKDEERERETAETGKLQFKVAHVSTSTFNSDPKAGAGQSSNTYRDRHFWGARGQPWTHPPFPEPPAEHVKARCPPRLIRQARVFYSSSTKATEPLSGQPCRR